MLKTLAGLITELRAVGIPVSPTEHIDAAAALRHTAIEDRLAVKAALSATLVKNAEHWQAFSTVFDLYFAGRRRDLRDPELSEMDSGEPVPAKATVVGCSADSATRISPSCSTGRSVTATR